MPLYFIGAKGSHTVTQVVPDRVTGLPRIGYESAYSYTIYKGQKENQFHVVNLDRQTHKTEQILILSTLVAGRH